MNFVIDRSLWRCAGHGHGPTLMLNSQGFMCGAGQCALQSGLTPDDILGVATPSLAKHKDKLRGFLLNLSPGTGIWEEGTLLLKQVLRFNDMADDAERESKLSTLFSEHGLTLTFTGSY